MALGNRHDPILSYNFSVESGGIFIASFSEVSGLQAEIEVNEYREGGVNEYMHKFPGPARYPGNLVLKRGVTDDQRLWSWYCKVLQGTVVRQNVAIVLMDSAGAEQRRWTFKSAYPVKWAGPDFKAQSSEVSIESVEFAHEGLLFANSAPPPPPVAVEFDLSVTVEAPQIEVAADVEIG